MQLDNNSTRIRRELLVKIAKLYFKGNLLEKIDRLPIEMRPKNSPISRCCVHKERAVLKYRIMAVFGFSVEDEVDELIPLSDYAALALNRESVSGPVLTVLDEACSSCVRSSYFITNACRGCFARPCTLNCPKKCIHFEDGQAHIDPEKCINCGRCMQVCPYHAIIQVPIPCEEECPVAAIHKAEDGRQVIDQDKCINCGKCIIACPFGAIMEKSQMIDVLKHFGSGREVVAMIAPSIVGQFSAPVENIVGALKQLGFDKVVEVAVGADVVADREAHEFTERMHQGEEFMTTSCCPGYTETVAKHVPELQPFVSKTCTPLHFTAELVAQQYPDALKVFIGPCVAKRNEALNDPLVDYTLTFEELGALFIGKDIEVEDCEPISADITGLKFGRGFPVSGGVTAAIEAMLDDESETQTELVPEQVNGITKQEIKKLKTHAKGSTDFNFLEVMCCEGGCVAGPCVIANRKAAAKKVENLTNTSS